jgi:glycosyltransferase involved in cell wall biosynthesis
MTSICLVVPCYNEERRLPRQAFMAFLRTHPDISLCFVDDGSTDGTLGVLNQLRAQLPDQILVLTVAPNGGKAEAVRAGVRHAHATGGWPLIGYWDADLSTPLSEVEGLRRALDEQPSCVLAMGSRVKRLGSHVERRVLRHVLGRMFATASSQMLGLAVYDSQCGAKLFRRDLVPLLFRDTFITRWLFDLELLARLRETRGAEALKGVVEVPLGIWVEVGGSKLGMTEMAGVPMELLQLRARFMR